jgi:serine/threonine-protein kinase
MSKPNFPEIPNYEVQELLAQGANTCIFRAKHELSKRAAAVKILLPRAAAVPINVVRLQHEAKALSRCSHKGVVVVYDYGISPNQFPYLVMDYLPGTTLARILKERQTIELDDFNRLFSEACEAIGHIHKAGIIHRDLKPANLMTMPAESAAHVKIIDFGTAKMLGEDLPPTTSPDLEGEIRGTPAYMSPEQCMGQNLDARSDIFSLGSTMFEALTGRSPFLGADSRETMHNIVNREAPPLARIKPEAADLAPVVWRCLLKSADDRFQSMQEVAAALSMVAQMIKARG